jgi:hypothetical protein
MSDSILRSLGSVFDNRALYGSMHKVTIASLERAFETLTQALTNEATILFTITPDECHLNHHLVDHNVPIIGNFIERLRAHEVSTLTLKQGLSADECIALVELISQDPAETEKEGGVATKLESDTFQHIESRKVTYVELADEEVVTKKGSLPADPAAQAERTASVMSYLGVNEEDVSAADTAVASEIQTLIETPSELGSLIVQSAGSSLNMGLPSSTPVATEALQPLVDKIVTSLERTFDVLKTSKTARSQKGKKSLSKSLAALESNLCALMQEVITPIDESDLAPISDAIESMTDELAIDALASEYLRKRKLIEASEERLLRYISRQGGAIDDSDLKTKLLDGGLSAWNWETLLLTSGAKDAKGNALESATKDMPEFKRLHDMLAQLAECFSDVNEKSSLSPDDIKTVISQVEERMEKLIANTRKRMEKLASHVSEERADDIIGGAKPQKHSRRQLLELIAEIVQELCQPLSVIQCSFDVLLTGQIAEVSPAQRELLSMAHRSAKRLDLLIHELVSVVGTPSDLVPKERTKDLAL